MPASGRKLSPMTRGALAAACLARSALITGLSLAAIACHKTAPSLSSTPPVPVGQADALRMYTSRVSHVMLASVFEERIERRPLPQKHTLHLKARVVRSYKGAWKEAEVTSSVRGVKTFQVNLPAPISCASLVGSLSCS